MKEKFNLHAAEYLVEFLESDGYEAEIYKNYSGRGMYGSTCVGIVTNAPGVAIGEAMGEYNRERSDFSEPRIKSPAHTDNMGLSTIYY